jgi:hypothetical protein
MDQNRIGNHFAQLALHLAGQSALVGIDWAHSSAYGNDRILPLYLLFKINTT